SFFFAAMLVYVVKRHAAVHYLRLNEEKVKKAVFKMHLWKAPGPDGFPAGFYQKSWDIVGSNVYVLLIMCGRIQVLLQM
ncbi:retrovirus-related Pol polyprotein from transposon TNT 1-94, partial [Trifolium medium]|nr:retrovirus-related Pol polyprotein from transposon TNT 1-94 [Trifolium medium]